MPNSKERLIALLSAAATADNAEEDAAVLSEFESLFEPAETREVMGGAFLNVFGYNPITYYDRKDMEHILDTMSASVNDRAGKYLRKHSKDIITGAMTILECKRERNLYDAVLASIKEYGKDDIDEGSWSQIQDWVAEKFAQDDRPNPEFEDDDDDDDIVKDISDSSDEVKASDFEEEDEDETELDIDPEEDDEDHIDTSGLGFVDDDDDNDELIDELLKAKEEEEDDDE